MGAAKPSATTTAMRRVVLWLALSTVIAYPTDTLDRIAGTVKVAGKIVAVAGEAMVKTHHLVAVALLVVAVAIMACKVIRDIVLLVRRAFAVAVTCACKLVMRASTPAPVAPPPHPTQPAAIKTQSVVKTEPEPEPESDEDALRKAAGIFIQAWNANAMYQIKRDSYWAAEGTKKMKNVLIENGVPDTETRVLNHVCWTIHSLNGHVNSTYKKTQFASMSHEDQRAVAVKLIFYTVQ
jgi:hypothetical protein